MPGFAARLLCWVAVAAAPFLCSATAAGMQIEGGEEFTDAQAEKAVRDSLGGRTRYPFYDRAKDDTRRLNVESPRDADSANRQSKWAGKKAAARNTAPAGPRGLSGPLGSVLQVLGLTALVVFIGILAWLIARAFLKQETTETVVSKVVETSRDVDRVEALPFAVRKPTGDFESEARRLYEAGQYSEAIIYLYSHLLVQLDRHHVIRLAKGKTNRQYLRETRSRPVLREILDRTMIAFEDVFFGHHVLSREAFEACWQRLDEFHAELDREERAAA
jgi:hypothetical protein